jgi:hypothetical protein
MAVPFMFAYTELLVKTCHARGAHAMGGMAAFIPSRRDPEVNEVALAKVREDKEREAGQGFDGTWVAHPDLVPVAMEIFDRVLGDRPNQLERQRDDVSSTAADLLAVSATPGEITMAGLHNNVSVGIQYLAAWLQGSGAVAIFNLMEDAATSEISRSQVAVALPRPDARTDVGCDRGTVSPATATTSARFFEQVARRRVRRGPHCQRTSTSTKPAASENLMPWPGVELCVSTTPLFDGENISVPRVKELVFLKHNLGGELVARDEELPVAVRGRGAPAEIAAAGLHRVDLLLRVEAGVHRGPPGRPVGRSP